MDSRKLLLMGTALAGLAMASTSALAHGGEDHSKTKKEVMCYGVNSCKGQGKCAGSVSGCSAKGSSCSMKLGCSGKNACKGKGLIKMKKDTCLKKGGKVASN